MTQIIDIRVQDFDSSHGFLLLLRGLVSTGSVGPSGYARQVSRASNTRQRVLRSFALQDRQAYNVCVVRLFCACCSYRNMPAIFATLRLSSRNEH